MRQPETFRWRLAPIHRRAPVPKHRGSSACRLRVRGRREEEETNHMIRLFTEAILKHGATRDEPLPGVGVGDPLFAPGYLDMPRLNVVYMRV
jgi:hypothetical protein